MALRWDVVDLKQGLLHVNRLKNGVASMHPPRGPELRALRKVAREYPETPYVSVTERKGPLTPDTVRKLISRAGEAAGISFSIHPICCVTPAATSSQTKVTTRARSSTISGTRTSSTL